MTRCPFLSRSQPLQNHTHVTVLKSAPFLNYLKKKTFTFLLHFFFISDASDKLGIFTELWVTLLLFFIPPLHVAMQLLRLPRLSTSMSNSKIMTFSLSLFFFSILPFPVPGNIHSFSSLELSFSTLLKSSS